jgi:hypothetical protein
MFISAVGLLLYANTIYATNRLLKLRLKRLFAATIAKFSLSPVPHLYLSSEL